MREIRFRAWTEPEHKMMNWNDLLRRNLNNIFMIPYRCGMILMQYTGLKDKNGKEIYEGDIITNGDKNIKYIVEWIDTGLKARQCNNQSYIGLNYWKDNLEVIRKHIR